jgi:uncharacterized protein YycO
MKVIYCANHTLSSWLIRLVTWSRWSHAAVQIDDETIIDATFKHGGVHARPLSALAGYRQEVVEYTLPDEDKAQDWLRRQIGKPYDWSALLGIFLHRNWQEDDKWFCSELTECALAAGGLQRWLGESINRVTPGMGYFNTSGAVIARQID